MQLGRGHTEGDTVVWLPQEKILFSGDLVEYEATPYTATRISPTGRTRSTTSRRSSRRSSCPGAARR
jgi:glyoxylase-like metal-dependent hydrolase (beta-lactamase superfamily II)